MPNEPNPFMAEEPNPFLEAKPVDAIEQFQKTYDISTKPEEPSWWDKLEGKGLDIQRYAKESVKDVARQYPLLLPRFGKAVVSGIAGLGEMGVEHLMTPALRALTPKKHHALMSFWGDASKQFYRNLGDLVEGDTGANREDVQDLYTAKTGPGKVLQTVQELAPLPAMAAVAPELLPAYMGLSTTGQTYRATEGAPEDSRTLNALGQGGLATALSYLPMGRTGEALGNKLLGGVIKSPVARRIAAGGLAVAGEALPWEFGSNAITKATIDSKQPFFSPKGYAEKVLTFGAMKIPHMLNAGWKPMDPTQYSASIEAVKKSLASAEPVPGEGVHDSVNRTVGTGKSIAVGLNRISETLQHVISPKEAEVIQRWKEDPSKVQLDPNLQQKYAEYIEPLEQLRDHIYQDVQSRLGEVQTLEEVQTKNKNYVPRPVKGKGGFIDSIMESIRKPLDLGGAFNEEIAAGQGGRILKEPEDVKHREIMTMQGPDGEPVVVKRVSADEYVGLKNGEKFVQTGKDANGNPIWGTKGGDNASEVQGPAKVGELSSGEEGAGTEGRQGVGQGIEGPPVAGASETKAEEKVEPVSIKLKDGTKLAFEHPDDVAEVQAARDTLKEKITQLKKIPMTTEERKVAIQDVVKDHDTAIKGIAKKTEARKALDAEGKSQAIDEAKKQEEAAPKEDRRLNPKTRAIVEDLVKRIPQMSPEEASRTVGEITRMVHTDELTGLGNKRAWLEEIPDAIENGHQFTTYDAKDLKWINDTYGHEFGDQLLVRISDAFKATGHKTGFYRAGGDEFWTHGASAEELGRVTEKIKAYLAEHPLSLTMEGGDVFPLEPRFAHGTGKSIESAEKALHSHQSQLRASGEDTGRGSAPQGFPKVEPKSPGGEHRGQVLPESPKAKEVEPSKEKGFALRQATTDEIESQSNIRYHKDYATNLLSQVGKLTNYRDNLAMVQGLKQQGIEAPEGKDLPEGYKTTTLPDMKGMAFPENIAKAMDKVHIELQHGNKSIAQNLMRLCTGSIFLNPIGHILNTGYHATLAVSVNAALHPLSAGRYLPRDLLRACKGIINMTPEAMKALESGSASMSNPDLARSVEANTRYALSRMENSAGIKEFAAKLGMAPADAVKGIYKASQNVLWTADDILRLTFRNQVERTHPNWSDNQINHEVDKHIASYRWDDKTPTTLIRIAQNKALAFTRYHSFLVKSLGELGKDAVWNQKGVEDPQAARREAMFRIAALGLFGIVIKPALDAGLKKITGEEKAEIPTAGPTSLLAEGIHVAEGTKRPEQALLSHLATFSPGFIRPLEALTNIDFYRRKDVASEESPVVDRLKHLATAFNPFAMYSQLEEGRNPKQFWLSQAGVRFKGTGAEQVWGNLRSKYSGMARQGPTEREASVVLGKLKQEIKDNVDLNNPESIKENLGWMGPAAIKMFQSGDYSQKQLENLLKTSIQSRPMNLAYSMKASGASPEDIWKVYQHGETPEKIALAVVLEQKLLGLKADSLSPKRIAKIKEIADSLKHDLLRPAMQDALRKIKEDKDFSQLRLDEENTKAEDKE